MLLRRLAAIATTAVLGIACAPAFAADCAVEIDGNDAMQFNRKEIEVSSACKSFTVTLRHSGKLPKQAMGHNWVLAKTAEVPMVASDGIAAGLANNYVKAGDARVVAHTRILGGGESDSVSFSPAKLAADGSYTFFCSFPGHSTLMKGTLKLVK
ncbi:azurin [Variovorax sp. J22P168]|uniref:azurin n=1 Tax=Variovorax jilinensis TaxID=3053513 RepID=UPI002576142F|nr:azurin [Variovorax sp. J22P168]MDM0014276.1 azurin [Variovorax sp. J22P168]